MPNQSNQNNLVLIILTGGVLFVLLAGCVAGVLLWQTPTSQLSNDSITVTPSTGEVHTPTPVGNEVVSAEIDTKVEPLPVATSTSTSIPGTAMPTPASIAGDQLSMPTATFTPPLPTPTSTPTNTPTPRPPPTVPEPVEGLGIGYLAPNFTLGSNRASRVSLSELRGKIVILNFWASWCPPCRHEVPALQAIHHEYGPQGVVVLAVNLGEKLENVERFAHDNGISFAVWLDEDKWAGNIYGVRSIPTTYFIDQDGIIRTIQFGSMTREQIINHLEKLL